MSAITLSIPSRYSHQDATLEFMKQQTRTFDMSDAGCVDAHTDFLTPRGWKSIADYHEDDLVAQVNSTGDVSFVTPTAYINEPTEGFYHVTGERVDMALSSEHRVLLTKVHTKVNTTLPMVELAKEFDTYKKYHHIPISAKLTVPTASHGLNRSELTAQLLCALVGQHPRAQTRESLTYWYVEPISTRQEDLILSLIDRTNHKDYVIGSRMPNILGKSRPLYIMRLRHTSFDVLPDYFYNLAPAEITYLFDMLYKWCGEDGNSVNTRYFTRITDGVFNWMQYAALQVGVSVYRRGDKVVQGRLLTSPIKAVRYVHVPNARKYCFTVPMGYLLLRRNGYSFVTGNSGKTRGQIDIIAHRPDINNTLIIAPKSLLTPAWANDFKKFSPDHRVVVATATNREKAFATPADVYITNTDAVTWLAKQTKKFLSRFNNIVIDESEGFKHRTSARSKAAVAVMERAKYRALLSATPSDNGVLDLWHQMYLLDGGATLGTNFYRFQDQFCASIPSPYGAYATWVQKPLAQEMVSELIKDHVVRHRLEDCIDIPPYHAYCVKYTLSSTSRKHYNQMQRVGLTMLDNGELIEAVNAVAVTTKLRQIASGAAYSQGFDEASIAVPHLIDTTRYELTVDLATQVPHSLIFFEWKHQRDGLCAILDAKKINYAIIDGRVKMEDRDKHVQDFQDGKLRILLLHPQSGAHGLTLTRATRIVIASPNYRASLYRQMIGRIVRATQTQRTDIITVIGEDTIDETVYIAQQDKLNNQYSMLQLLHAYYKGAALC